MLTDSDREEIRKIIREELNKFKDDLSPSIFRNRTIKKHQVDQTHVLPPIKPR